MVKEPRAGRVKTRLGRDIGMTQAAWWFRHQTQSLLRKIECPAWHTVLAVAPDQSLTSGFWPKYLQRYPQGAGDLGDRMARMLRSMPPGPVCIIGADVPGITPKHVAEAFAALGRNDAVFGPAEDGGYWLVGLKRTRAVPPSIFRGVRWSSEHALADSIASVPFERIARVRVLRDVDTAADLP